MWRPFNVQGRSPSDENDVDSDDETLVQPAAMDAIIEGEDENNANGPCVDIGGFMDVEPISDDGDTVARLIAERNARCEHSGPCRCGIECPLPELNVNRENDISNRLQRPESVFPNNNNEYRQTNQMPSMGNEASPVASFTTQPPSNDNLYDFSMPSTSALPTQGLNLNVPPASYPQPMQNVAAAASEHAGNDDESGPPPYSSLQASKNEEKRHSITPPPSYEEAMRQGPGPSRPPKDSGTAARTTPFVPQRQNVEQQTATNLSSQRELFESLTSYKPPVTQQQRATQTPISRFQNANPAATCTITSEQLRLASQSTPMDQNHFNTSALPLAPQNLQPNAFVAATQTISPRDLYNIFNTPLRAPGPQNFFDNSYNAPVQAPASENFFENTYGAPILPQTPEHLQQNELVAAMPASAPQNLYENVFDRPLRAQATQNYRQTPYDVPVRAQTSENWRQTPYDASVRAHTCQDWFESPYDAPALAQTSHDWFETPYNASVQTQTFHNLQQNELVAAIPASAPQDLYENDFDGSVRVPAFQTLTQNWRQTPYDVPERGQTPQHFFENPDNAPVQKHTSQNFEQNEFIAAMPASAPQNLYENICDAPVRAPGSQTLIQSAHSGAARAHTSQNLVRNPFSIIARAQTPQSWLRNPDSAPVRAQTSRNLRENPYSIPARPSTPHNFNPYSMLLQQLNPCVAGAAVRMPPPITNRIPRRVRPKRKRTQKPSQRARTPIPSASVSRDLTSRASTSRGHFNPVPSTSSAGNVLDLVVKNEVEDDNETEKPDAS